VSTGIPSDNTPRIIAAILAGALIEGTTAQTDNVLVPAVMLVVASGAVF
jgi:hypothetical protein